MAANRAFSVFNGSRNPSRDAWWNRYAGVTINAMRVLCRWWAMFFLACIAAPAAWSAQEIRFVYIGPVDQEHSPLLGARQGLYEANLQGQFLGQNYTMAELSPETWQLDDLDDTLAIVYAGSKEGLQRVIDAVPNVPVFNIALRDDDLRMDCPARNLLHAIPSDSMLADAEEQWRQKSPNSQARAQGWHPDFKKFAARDLNKRHLKKQGRKMDEAAWAGWAAIKMTSDAFARLGIADAAQMLDHLHLESLAFDGQKGQGLHFRPTGQLPQLILLVEEDKIVAEAPVRGVAQPPTLDSLGILECAASGL